MKVGAVTETSHTADFRTKYYQRQRGTGPSGERVAPRRRRKRQKYTCDGKWQWPWLRGEAVRGALRDPLTPQGGTEGERTGRLRETWTAPGRPHRTVPTPRDAHTAGRAPPRPAHPSGPRSEPSDTRRNACKRSKSERMRSLSTTELNQKSTAKNF